MLQKRFVRPVSPKVNKMQAYKEIIQSIGIYFVVLYTDEGSSETLQMCRLTRDAPELALFAL